MSESTRWAARSLLPPRGRAGPTPWVVAVMTALAMLGLALALALAPASTALSRQIAGRATIQVVEGDPIVRRDAVAAVRRVLADAPYVTHVETVPEAELRGMAQRWLGGGFDELRLPLPALIDVDLVAGGGDSVARLRTALRGVNPRLRVVPHAGWLGPVAGLLQSLALIAVAIAAALMAGAVAVAMLAARAALAAQGGTIDVLHLVGATDLQIARMFQRQAARDFLFGVLVGGITALIAAGLIGWQMRALATPLIQGSGGPSWIMGLLLLVPIAILAFGVLTTRITILNELKKVP